MTKLVVNAFSKDYVTRITTDHKDRKYKKPVLNQPPNNARANINTQQRSGTSIENYRRIAKTEI